MNEEEAFIRAIVADPDDTARLVYADWLDDRDDPRGPYLRAEFEWAKPWKQGTPPGWSDRIPGRHVPEWSDKDWRGLAAMESLARPLDALWVARVSRPPVGVCCDHLGFVSSGPALTRDEIAAAEDDFGQSFPPALVAFLLNYNGGRPNRNQLVYRIEDDDGGYYDWIGLDHLAPLPAGGRDPGQRQTSLETVWDLRNELEYFQEELGVFGTDDVLTRYVPLGQSDLQILLLDCEGSPGEVYRIDTEVEGAVPEPFLPSLPQLLGRIITGGI